MRRYHVNVYGICLSRKNTAVEIYFWSCQAAWEEKQHKKRWQECTEELYKKDLNDPDNHEGMITHLQPGILECEVKWALGSITMNKASEGDEIPVELFQILKDDVWKWCTQYASKYGRLISGLRTGKDQFSFQYQRKAMPKNAQASAQLHSSYTISWRRKWQPTTVFLPGKSHGRRSLVVYSPWGHKESDMSEVLHYSPPILASTWSIFPKPMFLVTLDSFVILF